MHPNKAFDWSDPDGILRFVTERSFAHIFTASEEGLFVAHAPLLVTASGKIRFHLSRRNRATAHIEGRSLLVSLAGRNAYQSANWYASEDQVPSWHYETVEIEGVARLLTDEELVALLDELSDRHERKHSPERPWTRNKMADGKFEAMLNAIAGFEVDPTDIRGTRKFNQHKAAPDLIATIRGQHEAGREDIVAAIWEITGD